MKKSYEFHGFTIVESYGDWFVYGTSAETLKYGFVRRFDTNKEAEDFITEVLWFLNKIKISFLKMNFLF